MTVIIAIMAFIYLCVNIPKLKNKEKIVKLIFNLVLAVLVTSFYWAPMLEAKSFTDYAVYQDDYMATAESVASYALDWKSYFNGIYEIGIHILIILLLPILFLKKFWKELQCKKEYILFLILGILSLIFASKLFPWEQLGEYLEIIQFPWRMLVFSNFFFAIICAININVLVKNFKALDALLFAVICGIYIITLKGYIPIAEESITPIEEWDLGYLDENYSQAMAGMGKGEYLPVKANENRTYIVQREDTIYALKGNIEILEYEKSGQTLFCELETLEDETVVELPYIYYPGYEVTVSGEEVEAFESDNGFLAISLNEAQDYIITVQYTGTTIMNITKIISVISLLGFVIYIFVFWTKP